MGKPYSMDLRERVMAAIDVDTGCGGPIFDWHCDGGCLGRLKRATGEVLPGRQGKPKGSVLDVHKDFILGVLKKAARRHVDEMVERLGAASIRWTWRRHYNEVRQHSAIGNEAPIRLHLAAGQPGQPVLG